MKQPGKESITLIISLLLTILLLQSCSTHTRQTSYLPPVKITIPEDANNDSSLVSFIKNQENRINNISNNFENIAGELSYYFETNDKISIIDKVKIIRLSLKMVEIENILFTDLSEINNLIEQKEKNSYNNVNISVYLAVKNALLTRINTLNKKYKKTIDKIKSSNYENLNF